MCCHHKRICADSVLSKSLLFCITAICRAPPSTPRKMDIVVGNQKQDQGPNPLTYKSRKFPLKSRIIARVATTDTPRARGNGEPRQLRSSAQTRPVASTPSSGPHTVLFPFVSPRAALPLLDAERPLLPTEPARAQDTCEGQARPPCKPPEVTRRAPVHALAAPSRCPVPTGKTAGQESDLHAYARLVLASVLERAWCSLS